MYLHGDGEWNWINYMEPSELVDGLSYDHIRQRDADVFLGYRIASE
jgi:hypothetical protein